MARAALFGDSPQGSVFPSSMSAAARSSAVRNTAGKAARIAVLKQKAKDKRIAQCAALKQLKSRVAENAVGRFKRSRAGKQWVMQEALNKFKQWHALDNINRLASKARRPIRKYIKSATSTYAEQDMLITYIGKSTQLKLQARSRARQWMEGPAKILMRDEAQ